MKISRRFLFLLLLLPLPLCAQEPSTTVPSDENFKAHPDWNAECQARVNAMKGKRCDLIFIGDSITQNFVEQPSAAWPLAGRPVWDHYYGNRNALNFGVGADRTQHILWRMEHMGIQEFRPKVAVILAGTNNVPNTAMEIATGVQAVIKKTQQMFPGVKIILVSIMPRNTETQKVIDANALIARLADQRTVFFFNLFAKMPAVGDNYKGLGFDHLHVTPEGYELWASEMEPLLEKLMPLGSPTPPQR